MLQFSLQPFLYCTTADQDSCDRLSHHKNIYVDVENEGVREKMGRVLFHSTLAFYEVTYLLMWCSEFTNSLRMRLKTPKASYRLWKPKMSILCLLVMLHMPNKNKLPNHVPPKIKGKVSNFMKIPLSISLKLSMQSVLRLNEFLRDFYTAKSFVNAGTASSLPYLLEKGLFSSGFSGYSNMEFLHMAHLLCKCQAHMLVTFGLQISFCKSALSYSQFLVWGLLLMLKAAVHLGDSKDFWKECKHYKHTHNDRTKKKETYKYENC